jgi:hypothetical protein
MSDTTVQEVVCLILRTLERIDRERRNAEDVARVVKERDGLVAAIAKLCEDTQHAAPQMPDTGEPIYNINYLSDCMWRQRFFAEKTSALWTEAQRERDEWKEKANVLCESALRAERERDSLSLALSAIMEMLGIESDASLLPCALHNERAASQERWERAERERDELIGQAADFAQERDELKAVVADAAQVLFVEHAPLTIASAARDALDTIDAMRREANEWKARAEAAEAGLAWRAMPAPTDKPCVVAYQRLHDDGRADAELCSFAGGYSKVLVDDHDLGWFPLPPLPTEPVREPGATGEEVGA